MEAHVTDKGVDTHFVLRFCNSSSSLSFHHFGGTRCLNDAYSIERVLNPTILDVVRKEVTKLLAVGIIYPISDNQWVSPIQVVPKKSGMTVMKNQHDELVTRKDHFPLPFIDQVLGKLVGKSHYCFLDGFSGYMQIHIALEDQHKTTFTCPFGTFAYTRMLFGLCNVPREAVSAKPAPSQSKPAPQPSSPIEERAA
ncbi:hypothetical protein CR513_40327, partial [Mucuna pruriens]